jgi:predicted adenylyl cyclase CyaB
MCAEWRTMRNVEAKFPLPDIAAAHQRAEALGFECIGTLLQHDTFFTVSNGKLKLREQPDGAWLIHYRRHRENGFELSNYEIVPVSEPLKLREMLKAALGVLAEVRKRRILLRRANVRLHLDDVENHGAFGELEAVLNEEEDPADSRIEIAAILTALQVPSGQLISASYFELTR